jgi:preprotein translocase subunit SecE
MAGVHDDDMADFLAVLGMVAFAVVMLGLIWGLDHV